MTSFLLLTAIVIFACVFLNRVSDKLSIPVLLAFILLGMFFGSGGPINIAFENYSSLHEVVSNALCKFFFTFLEEINHITISRSSGRMRSPN